MKYQDLKPQLLIPLLFSASLFYGALSTFLKTAGHDPAWKAWASGFATVMFFIFMVRYFLKMIKEMKTNSNA
ncbi:MAG: hypothetical protein AAF598_21615 [Bacteroidota bacterium]